MRGFFRSMIGGMGAVVLWCGADVVAHASCADPAAIGVSRTVEVDTSRGFVHGDITKLARGPDLLRPREVVLTFDDGPLPWITRSILDTLDRHCTKATFFVVGQMAQGAPEWVREELKRGHTVGSHSWSHPMPFRGLRPEQAKEEIERGFAAVAQAAGQPIAPFFRFPGLGDSADTVAYLATRNIATFSVDVVSNDSFVSDASQLTRETIQKVEARQGGIILFHDIKASTARALPTILAELNKRGYKVVHLRAKEPFRPLDSYVAALARAGSPTAAGPALPVPFYGARRPPGKGEGAAPAGVGAPPAERPYASELPWAPKPVPAPPVAPAVPPPAKAPPVREPGTPAPERGKMRDPFGGGDRA